MTTETSSAPTLLYLIRHGETDWNAQRRWQSHLDVPLNDKGRAQASRLARLAASWGLDALYSSDLARARETARTIAEAVRGPLRVVFDPRLREHDAGLLSGYTLDEIKACFAEWWAKNALDPHNTRTPGGEAFREVRARVVEAVKEIALRHAGGRVGIVTHGGPVKGVVYEVLGLDGKDPDLFRIDNCSLTVVQWGARPRLLAVNVTPDWLEGAGGCGGELG